MNPFFSYLMNGGVPRETIILLLMFPLIATFIVATRQIIGIKGFGIYTPLIITFAFLNTGFRYGATIFLVALLVGSLSRYLLRKLQMLYLPKMALILSITSLSMFLLLLEGVFSKRTVLISLSIYPILIIITLVEKFINVQIEKGYNTAVVLAVETFIISSVGYLIASLSPIREFVFAYPFVIILCFIFNIYIGKWDGLRISEYLRFKKIIENR